METKVIDGVTVKQVRANLWVSDKGKVWMENVGVPSKRGSYTVDKWHRTNAKTRVKIYNELRYRLVAEAWVNNPNPKLYTIINHIDGNPINDCAENLEWCDASHNSQHAVDTGLHTYEGSENWNQEKRSFTDKGEQEVHEFYVNSKARNRLDAVSEHFGISRSMLKNINKKWRI